jgi:hypothetical protein
MDFRKAYNSVKREVLYNIQYSLKCRSKFGGNNNKSKFHSGGNFGEIATI